ncbi:DUF1040 family protein [Clostridium scatologenes]|uniref:Uncharacterized protein n=1 Tax=Clostridium scatologenes TaxID=1548 RepID=A0A0E3K1L9_CLOSL|nr:DUF1040 family protein [Clostridium scatologenes]AKA70149.1 hypothetical protein CSCA_3024 [Clostridium scatologenes]
MRDEKRIDVLLELLREYWSKNPDLRLGQILSIAAKDIDTFYIEDDKVIEWLKENLNKQL